MNKLLFILIALTVLFLFPFFADACGEGCWEWYFVCPDYKQYNSYRFCASTESCSYNSGWLNCPSTGINELYYHGICESICGQCGYCTYSPACTTSCGNCGTYNTECCGGCGSTCTGEGVCSPGSTDAQAVSCGSGICLGGKVQERTCQSNCLWGKWYDVLDCSTKGNECWTGDWSSCIRTSPTLTCTGTKTQSYKTCDADGSCSVSGSRTDSCNLSADTSCGAVFCETAKHLVGSCTKYCDGSGNCGACAPSCSCESGYNDCNNDMSDGCETYGPCCVSHSSYSCYDDDVYWYDSCGSREDKKEECGADGWIDTGTLQWVPEPSNECKEKQQKEQQYRDYTCVTGHIRPWLPLTSFCTHSITDTRWIDTGSTRNKADGTSCGTDKICQNGECVPDCKADGQTCSSASECCSGDCTCGTCSGSCDYSPACSPTSETQSCGNCGTQTRTRSTACCGDCTAWSAWSTCTGQGVCSPGTTKTCGTNVGACQYGIQTCQTNCTWGSCVGAIGPTTEICDGKDNDCDGSIDEGLSIVCSSNIDCGANGCKYYANKGRDIYTIYWCANPGTCFSKCNDYTMETDADGDGYNKECMGDCDDSDASIHPGATEICDGKDNDCDGSIDEGLTRECTGACGSGIEYCDNGNWVGCDAPGCDYSPACSPLSESEGCGNCGTHTRTRSTLCCGGCSGWSSWGACTGDKKADGQSCSAGSECCSNDCTCGTCGGSCDYSPDCSPLSESEGCGNCGTQTRTRDTLCCGGCTDWSAWSSCTGEGVCSPGSTDAQGVSCGSGICLGGKVQVRTCQSNCLWGKWYDVLDCSTKGNECWTGDWSSCIRTSPTLTCTGTKTQSYKTCDADGSCSVSGSRTDSCNLSADTSCGAVFCETAKHLVGSCTKYCDGSGNCGACAPSCSCESGYNDCNNDMSDGCETYGPCCVSDGSACSLDSECCSNSCVCGTCGGSCDWSPSCAPDIDTQSCGNCGTQTRTRDTLCCGGCTDWSGWSSCAGDKKADGQSCRAGSECCSGDCTCGTCSGSCDYSPACTNTRCLNNKTYQTEGTACCGGCNGVWTNAGTDSDLDTYDNECESYDNDPCSVNALLDNCGNALGGCCATVDQNYCDYGCPHCGDGLVNCGEGCEKGSTQSCTGLCGGTGTEYCKNDCSGWHNCDAPVCPYPPSEILYSNPDYNSGWCYIAQTVPDNGVAFWLSMTKMPLSNGLLYGITNINTGEYYPGFLQGGSLSEDSDKVDVVYQNGETKVRFYQTGGDFKKLKLEVKIPYDGGFYEATKTIAFNRPIIYESGDGVISMGGGIDSLYVSLVLEQGFWIDFQKFNVPTGFSLSDIYSFKPDHRWMSFILDATAGSLPAGTVGVYWEYLDSGYKNFDLLKPGELQQTANNFQIEEIDYWDSGNKTYLKKWRLSQTDLGVDLFFQTAIDNQENLVLGNYFYEGATGIFDSNNFNNKVGTGMLEQTHDEKPKDSDGDGTPDKDDNYPNDPCSVNALLDNCGNALGGCCARVDQNYCDYGCVHCGDGLVNCGEGCETDSDCPIPTIEKCVPVTHPRNCNEECQARGGTCLYGDASADCSTGPGIWGCGARDVFYCYCELPNECKYATCSDDCNCSYNSYTVSTVFDTGESSSSYPSIPGNFIGWFTPNFSANITKIETYPCSGTGGKISSWHFENNLTGLVEGEKYKLYITFQSYPQYFHQSELTIDEGKIEFISFIDNNGIAQTNYIPALKMDGLPTCGTETITCTVGTNCSCENGKYICDTDWDRSYAKICDENGDCLEGNPVLCDYSHQGTDSDLDSYDAPLCDSFPNDPCSVNTLRDNCGNALGGACAAVDNNYCIYGCVNNGTCDGENVCSVAGGGWITHCGDGTRNCGEPCDPNNNCFYDGCKEKCSSYNTIDQCKTDCSGYTDTNICHYGCGISISECDGKSPGDSLPDSCGGSYLKKQRICGLNCEEISYELYNCFEFLHLPLCASSNCGGEDWYCTDEGETWTWRAGTAASDFCDILITQEGQLCSKYSSNTEDFESCVDVVTKILEEYEITEIIEIKEGKIKIEGVAEPIDIWETGIE